MIDPNTWNSGTDGEVVIAAVPDGCWQIQRVVLPEAPEPELCIDCGLPKTPPAPPDYRGLVVEYGQNVFRGNVLYRLMTDAIAAAMRETRVDQLQLVLQQGCIDLLDTRTAVFLNWDGSRWR